MTDAPPKEIMEEEYREGEVIPEAHLRGEETAWEKAVRDAQEPVSQRLSFQGYDPRQEPHAVKECGQDYAPEPFLRLTLRAPDPQEDRHDDHVCRHYRLLSRSQELRDLIELCWVFKTGRLKTAGKLQGATGGDCGPDRAEIAAEYLEGTPTFGELLWPVVVAKGEGRFTRAEWGNRTPSFPVARALWNPFMVRLIARLKAESFDAYYERRARELYVVPPVDHLEIAAAANFSK